MYPRRSVAVPSKDASTERGGYKDRVVRKKVRFGYEIPLVAVADTL